MSTAFGLEKKTNDQILAQEFLDTITKKEKIQILTLLPPDWSVYKVCDIMETTKRYCQSFEVSERATWNIIIT